MKQFEARAKKWGNSIGVTIPSEIVKEEKILPNSKVRMVLMRKPSGDVFRKVFGTFKTKKSTDQLMREIDEGYD
ncbi:MAG: AbrB/MazE/SpoVT family DNA-binding domain-containing protein [Candidatus Diapherotrites archaeon]